jgi:hypothetical protein
VDLVYIGKEYWVDSRPSSVTTSCVTMGNLFNFYAFHIAPEISFGSKIL